MQPLSMIRMIWQKKPGFIIMKIALPCPWWWSIQSTNGLNVKKKVEIWSEIGNCYLFMHATSFLSRGERHTLTWKKRTAILIATAFIDALAMLFKAHLSSIWRIFFQPCYQWRLALLVLRLFAGLTVSAGSLCLTQNLKLISIFCRSVSISS